MNNPNLTDKIINKQKKYLIIAIFCIVTLFIGSSFALLTSFKQSDEIINITTGNLSMTVNNALVSLNNKLPEPDEYGLQNATPVQLVLTNNGTMDIMKYEVKLIKDASQTSTLDYEYIKYALSFDNGVTYQTPKNLQTVNNIIYTGYNLSVGASKSIYLKVWIDEAARDNALDKVFYGSVDVELYQKFEDVVYNAKLKSDSVAACSNKTMTQDTTGIIYISGSNDCIDFNYVWYSGKMWRIVAIYPDGSMKLITDNSIVGLGYGESATDVNYYVDANNKSYIYQWLNEDFLDTLYNQSNILSSNEVWNFSPTTTIVTKPSTSDSSKMISTSISPVGLLNSYEYYMSYKNLDTAGDGSTGYTDGYLNIGYHWWLLNPYSEYYMWHVYGSNGNAIKNAPTYAYFVRPSIIIKAGIELIGTGTKTDPYKVTGDKTAPIYNTTLLNDRLSGEYIKIRYNGSSVSSTYRIIGMEKNPSDSSQTITKVILMGYLYSGSTLPFATANTSGSGTIFGQGNTVDDTNKGTWYSSISNWYNGLAYKSLLAAGNYYLVTGDISSNYNYKASICDSNSLTKTVSQCITDETTVSKTTFNAGLPRYGEMFATQQTESGDAKKDIWLITRRNATYVYRVLSTGSVGGIGPTSNTIAARPTIHLKSSVKILSGTGTEFDPFIVE